jgi:molybdopterin synthase catalytic subunit
MEFRITKDPIQTEAVARALHAVGAVVCFEGRVRSLNEGRAVDGLEYSSYETLALKEGARILEEAKERFGLLECHAIHRIGQLQLGDMAVWVAVAAGHRGEAFEGCRWIIDELKRRVPIWKKEHYADGDRTWLGGATP